ncbi:Uncharacterised protein [Haemophilus influenzae]|uniref:Uncharacterized protein n=1 Tax=Haemophilus influenzae TaxID=727 RepID=A0AAX3IRY2_HAEIF|nr:Uncharacterised protein [Haemophilus influenzae]VTX59399.1 Uncharacterised protein [Haemophilus influenzae]
MKANKMFIVIGLIITLMVGGHLISYLRIFPHQLNLKKTVY